MITIQDLTVSQLFHAARYVPDHDDQMYDWSAEQVTTRVKGLISAFFSFYQRHHTMEDFEKYQKMGFGSLCLRIAGENRAFLEGHKFFITLTLLLINLHVLQSRRIDSQIEAVKLEDLFFFFRKDCGEWAINPDFEPYGDCLRDLIRGKEMKTDRIPLPVFNLVARYNDIDVIIREEVDDRALPFLAAWLRDKIIIEVCTAEDERGARLLKSARAYDRLKGKLMRELTEAPDY